MPSPKEPVRINLTEDQKAQIRSQTGKDAEAVEFSVEELEGGWFAQTLVQHRQTFSFGGSPCPTPSSPSGSR